MRFDLWMPGILTDGKCRTLQLMNVMCNLTQFVVSILVSETTSECFGKVFMEQVVFTFIMVAVVVIDADNKFLHLFEEMCRALGFQF